MVLTCGNRPGQYSQSGQYWSIENVSGRSVRKFDNLWFHELFHGIKLDYVQ